VSAFGGEGGRAVVVVIGYAVDVGDVATEQWGVPHLYLVNEMSCCGLWVRLPPDAGSCPRSV